MQELKINVSQNLSQPQKARLLQSLHDLVRKPDTGLDYHLGGVSGRSNNSLPYTPFQAMWALDLGVHK